MSFYEQRLINTNDYNMNELYNENTKFVFIIPSFNNEKWIENNLNSIINQKYNNWNVIYINDNSNDKTQEIYEDIISKTEKNQNLKI